MNKYEVLSTIGEGAYGVVMKARHRETGELVAIKRFKESEEDESVRKTSQREVKLLRAMKDELYIVKLLEAFRRKGRLYLVFEYVGKNLLEELESQPQGLDQENVRRMIFTLLAALHACHSKDVIHRDIKPENLLVHTDGTLRLCDFGFARAYSKGANDLTDYVATRWYRSPELLLGTSDYGLPSDIWAVGCIMSELLDGQALFPGETEVDQLFLIQAMLGNFTSQQIATFKANSRFASFTLPDVPKPENTLERRFMGRKVSKRALSLLKLLLNVNPNHRPTVLEAMRHPFFEGLADSLTPHLKDILHPDVLGRPSSPEKPILSRPSTAGQPSGKIMTSQPPLAQFATFDPSARTEEVVLNRQQQPQQYPSQYQPQLFGAFKSPGQGQFQSTNLPSWSMSSGPSGQEQKTGLLPKRLGSGHHTRSKPSATSGHRTRSHSNGRDHPDEKKVETSEHSYVVNAPPSIPPMNSQQPAPQAKYAGFNATSVAKDSRNNLPKLTPTASPYQTPNFARSQQQGPTLAGGNNGGSGGVYYSNPKPQSRGRYHF